MPSREKMDRYRNIPYSEWKCYKVPIIGGFGSWHYTEAPNKTLAREFTIGELNPWVKVRGRIIEIPEEEFPEYRVFGPKNYDGWERKR